FNVNYVDGESGYVELRQSTYIPDPDIFTRAYIYLPESSTSATFNFSMVYDAQGYAALGVELANGQMALGGWGEGGATGTDASPFPVDTWVCIEWQYHGGDSPSVNVWRDDELVMDNAPASWTATLDATWIGIYGYQNAGPVDLWVDDLAISG